MARHHGLLLALLVLALGWAYLLTHPVGSGGGASKEITLWELPLERIEALSFRDKATEVSLAVTPDAGGKDPRVWIASTHPPSRKSQATQPHARKPPPRKLSGLKGGAGKAGTEQGAGTGGEETPATEQSEFMGNPNALGALRHFAKAKALRDLGPLTGLDPATFGLSGDTGQLELRRTGGEAPLVLVLGRTSFGGAHRYVLEPGRGRVYLMSNGEFRKLSQAHINLMDRRLLGLNQREIGRIDLSLGSLRLSFQSEEGAGVWRDTSGTDRTDWVNRLMPALFRLHAQGYMSEEEGAAAKAQPDPNPLALEFWRQKSEGEPDARLRLGGGSPWAESTHTGRPVSLEAGPLEALRAIVRELAPGT